MFCFSLKFIASLIFIVASAFGILLAIGFYFWYTKDDD